MSSNSDEGLAPSIGQLSSRLVHDGHIVRLSVDSVRFPDGSTGELEMIRHSGASAIIPFLDPPGSEDPRVVLIRQYRYACDGEILEVPAGRPDQLGEPWEECAHRELEEETGYQANNLRYLTSIYTTPGFTDELIRLFAAWNLEEGDINRDADEFIDLLTPTLSEAVALVHSGEIVDAKSISALLIVASVRHTLQ